MAVIAATGDVSSSEAFAVALSQFHEDYFVRAFSPDGSGAEMEALIRNQVRRDIVAVFDFSPVELLTGTAGPDRLTAAGAKGLPQLISVCGLDFHPTQNRPTTPEERDALGKVIVERACAAKGLTIIALPLRGFRGEGADDPLFQSIRSWAYPPKLLIEFDYAVNDLGFGMESAEALLNLIVSK